jgi:hypothetical protein
MTDHIIAQLSSRNTILEGNNLIDEWCTGRCSRHKRQSKGATDDTGRLSYETDLLFIRWKRAVGPECECGLAHMELCRFSIKSIARRERGPGGSTGSCK